MLKQLSHEEAQVLMATGNVLVADVRDQDSFEEAHIIDAIHLSMSKLQEFTDTADKSQPILVYCYHGVTSQSVGQHLVDQGFTDVYSLVGGFEAWKVNHPYATDS